MTRRVAYAFVVLVTLAAIPGWLGLFWEVHQTNAYKAAQRHDQAEQRRQGEVIERKLCTSLAELEPLAGLNAPAGNPARNPSRAYEQKLNHALKPLAQLDPDIGCVRSKP